MEIKRELLGKKLNTREEKRASLSAFMRTNGCLSFTQNGLGFVLVTESERVAERYLALLEELYGILCTTNAKEDRLSGKDKLTFAYNGEKAYDVLIDLGVFERGNEGNYELYSGIGRRLLPSEDAKLAYIAGAFLGGGSCTLPRGGAKTGYHLEFIFTHEETAADFTALLEEYELVAKTIPRKDSFVVYFTSVSVISDFLAVIGANGALERLNRMAQAREGRNNDNRKNNCFVGNMDRTATASAKQCLIIGYLQEKGILAQLDENLRITAQTRLAYPEASLSELSERLSASKSCVNHRMRKLTEIYEESKKEEEVNE
jgi:hypothetical protein